MSKDGLQSDPASVVKPGSFSAGGMYRQVILKSAVSWVEVFSTIEGTCMPQCCAVYGGEAKYDRWGHFIENGQQILMIDLDCLHVEFKICFGKNVFVDIIMVVIID